MKLPDYKTCVDFLRLREKMGAYECPVLPIVKFERTITKTTTRTIAEPDDKELQVKLQADAVSATRSQIRVEEKGLLSYRGRKVAAYIRDQRTNLDPWAQTSEYRYHLTECSTLKSMRAAGRERRYLVTQRHDGVFLVHDCSVRPHREFTARLQLCKNCIGELQARGIYLEPFSLKQFFDRHDSYVPRTITKTESTTEIQTYQPNQAELAREYKRAVDWRCQQCSVHCEEHPQLLHLHHVDGNPANNTHANLRVLCVECHSRQPYHSQVGAAPMNARRIKDIRKLRRRQGIIDLGAAS